jgi:hypothetical protein
MQEGVKHFSVNPQAEESPLLESRGLRDAYVEVKSEAVGEVPTLRNPGTIIGTRIFASRESSLDCRLTFDFARRDDDDERGASA